MTPATVASTYQRYLESVCPPSTVSQYPDELINTVGVSLVKSEVEDELSEPATISAQKEVSEAGTVVLPL